ncbi:MAG TPA: c-type cytochrome [Thermoanaerobaculia bacterium]|nr:c-type cytochrome [Thermoanaerobaculia bacterium]
MILVIVALAAIAALTVVRHGVSARETPTATEAMLAGALRSMAIPRAAKAMKNPVPFSDAVMSEASAHWADHCAPCHGLDGKGDTEMGRGLYPKTPDISDGSPDLGDGELFYIITNGVRLTGMPAWGDPRDSHSNEQTWHLVHFIRHLPRLTPAEREQLRKEKESDEEFLSGK